MKMQLSKLEDKAYETLKRNKIEVFRIKDICLLIGINKTKAYNLIKSLKRKRAIESIKKGDFSLRGTNEFIIATSLNWPSYISFWTSLNYYGFSDQMPQKIFLASTKYHKETKQFKYITISRKRFFGYQNINGIVIAEKEKAIIDSLLFPKYSGGISEIIFCIKSGEKRLDINKIVDYALKAESKALIRRLGFILEKLGIKKTKLLEKNIGEGYELLDPTLKKRNNLNKKWLLDVNIK